jgi:hypothetical protein
MSEADSNHHLDRSVDTLELSIRPYNFLKDSNIKTIRDLVQIPGREMLKTRNFGLKSLREIQALLSEMGLSLVLDDDLKTAMEKAANPKPAKPTESDNHYKSYPGCPLQERHVRISKAAGRVESRYAISSTFFRENSIFATDGRIIAITQNDTGFHGEINFNGNHIVSGSHSIPARHLPPAKSLAQYLPEPDDDCKITVVLDNLLLQRLVAAICKKDTKRQVIQLEFVPDGDGRVNNAIAVQAVGNKPKSYGLLMPMRGIEPRDGIRELARLLRDEPMEKQEDGIPMKDSSNLEQSFTLTEERQNNSKRKEKSNE